MIDLREIKYQIQGYDLLVKIPISKRELLAMVEEVERLRTGLAKAREALEYIAEEPNNMGPIADEVVDEYNVTAWGVANLALRSIDESGLLR